MTKRRRISADFKARVALEALRGDKTIQEIAVKHKVHPNQVSTWKRPHSALASQTPAEAYAAERPVGMPDKANALPLNACVQTPQDQQQQQDVINRNLAA